VTTSTAAEVTEKEEGFGSTNSGWLRPPKILKLFLKEEEEEVCTLLTPKKT
jgi:hypothetical protein